MSSCQQWLTSRRPRQAPTILSSVLTPSEMGPCWHTLVPASLPPSCGINFGDSAILHAALPSALCLTNAVVTIYASVAATGPCFTSSTVWYPPGTGRLPDTAHRHSGSHLPWFCGTSMPQCLRSSLGSPLHMSMAPLCCRSTHLLFILKIKFLRGKGHLISLTEISQLGRIA